MVARWSAGGVGAHSRAGTAKHVKHSRMKSCRMKRGGGRRTQVRGETRGRGRKSRCPRQSTLPSASEGKRQTVEGGVVKCCDPPLCSSIMHHCARLVQLPQGLQTVVEGGDVEGRLRDTAESADHVRPSGLVSGQWYMPENVGGWPREGWRSVTQQRIRSKRQQVAASGGKRRRAAASKRQASGRKRQEAAGRKRQQGIATSPLGVLAIRELWNATPAAKSSFTQV